jgi:hypothetical protein
VSREARTRAAAAAAIALVVGGTLAFGRVSGTFAIFTAETANPNAVFQGGWVNPATSLSASVSGYGASFTWTPGNTGSSPFGALSGQQLEGSDQGATNSCSGATYHGIGSALGASTGSTTDAESSSVNGHYFCYVMRDFANAWYADASFSPNPVQVGLVPTSVTIDGDGDKQPDDNDTITISFNQNVSITATSDICLEGSSNAIAIGDGGSCSDPMNGSIGTLTGFTQVKKTTDVAATISASGHTITVTVTASGSKNVTGNATFTAGTGVTSSSGGASACTSPTYGCTPSVTNTF